MKVRLSCRRALAVFTKLEARLVRQVRSAEALTLVEAKAALVALSDGPLSSAELRRRDHPYARRHGSALVEPSLLNRQSGNLKRHWTASGPVRSGKGLRSRVRNSASYARYMRGTTKMLPRPILQRALRQIRPARRYRLRRALWFAVTTRS